MVFEVYREKMQQVLLLIKKIHHQYFYPYRINTWHQRFKKFERRTISLICY